MITVRTDALAVIKAYDAYQKAILTFRKADIPERTDLERGLTDADLLNIVNARAHAATANDHHHSLIAICDKTMIRGRSYEAAKNAYEDEIRHKDMIRRIVREELAEARRSEARR